MGPGVRIGSPSGRALVTGYRFQHISNGSPSLPSPAVDTHLVYVGVSVKLSLSFPKKSRRLRVKAPVRLLAPDV